MAPRYPSICGLVGHGLNLPSIPLYGVAPGSVHYLDLGPSEPIKVPQTAWTVAKPCHPPGSLEKPGLGFAP